MFKIGPSAKEVVSYTAEQAMQHDAQAAPSQLVALAALAPCMSTPSMTRFGKPPDVLAAFGGLFRQLWWLLYSVTPSIQICILPVHCVSFSNLYAGSVLVISCCLVGFWWVSLAALEAVSLWELSQRCSGIPVPSLCMSTECVSQVHPTMPMSCVIISCMYDV